MRALVVTLGAERAARVRDDQPEPIRNPGQLLVQGLLVGVCGTDREILEGRHGAAPPHTNELVLGHESLGRVLECDGDGTFSRGDLVAGIVRRPDPLPCACCAAGEWDMCLNGNYSERGIRGAHGYASERYMLESAFAVKVPASLGELGVLVEPASIVAKAWEQVERVSARCASYAPRRVLVTGAGPIGLLAALLGVQRGYQVEVLDRALHGPKPALVRELGARYVTGPINAIEPQPEIVIECTGSEEVVLGVLIGTARNSIVCLTGVSSGARKLMLAASAFNNEVVLENGLVFGTVNANRRHYTQAVEALTQADPVWLSRLITRRVPLSLFRDAITRQKHDVKVVLDLRA